MDISYNDKKRAKNTRKFEQGGYTRARENGYTRPESEKTLESSLVREVSRMGGKCLKYASSTTTGYPDRLVLLPEGCVFWVELKTTGRKPGKKQQLRHQELRDLGQVVYVVDSMSELEMAVALMNRAVIAERIRREEEL